jgi:MFS family permease
MTSRQWSIVWLCVLLNFNDGIDVLSLSFAAPEIMKDWSLSKAAMGYAFSAGLAGMMIGSLLLAPWGDRIGRKKIFFLALLLISTGMLGVAISQSYLQLLLFRLLTGSGIGALLPAMAAVAAEHSNEKWRDFNVGLVQGGWPIGAILLGFISTWAIPAYGWRSIYAIAGGFSLLMMVAVALVMDEPKGSFQRSTAPPASTLLTPAYRRSTLLIWLAIFSGFFTMYTLISWTPAVVREAGLDFRQGTLAGILFNLGAALGTIGLGAVAALPRMSIRSAVLSFLTISIILLVSYGSLSIHTTAIFALVTAFGIFVQGGFNGIYAIGARVYPKAVRTTGVGLAIGVGRMGAVLGPSVFGRLADGGLSTAQLFFLFAIPLLVMGCCVFLLRSNTFAE